MEKCKECDNRVRLIDGGVRYTDEARCIVCLKKLLKSEKRKTRRLSIERLNEKNFRNALEQAQKDWPEA